MFYCLTQDFCFFIDFCLIDLPIIESGILNLQLLVLNYPFFPFMSVDFASKLVFFHDTKSKFWKILSGKSFLWKIPIPSFAAGKCYLPQDPTPFHLLFSMLINDFIHFLFAPVHQPASSSHKPALK